MSEKPHVVLNIERPDPTLVEKMSRYPAATIHEAYGGRGAATSEIKPISQKMKLCGPAVTVKARPGDNIILHRAIYAARPGDVLVVDAGGYLEAGLWGSLMTRAAWKQGLAGLVTNGCVRDADEIEEMGFPVFSRGLSIKGTTKNCLGLINHPITFSGVHIEPGDLVRGDRDGVVVVGRKDLAEVIEKSEEREQKEKRTARELDEGRRFLDIAGFEEKLERMGLKEE